MNLTQGGIGGISVGVACLFVWMQRRAGAPWKTSAAGAAAWMALWLAVASSGALRAFDARPPPMVVVFVATMALGFGVGLSRVGERLAGLSLGVLVTANGFRLPLEWVMHVAAERGVMPLQMSWSGWNFDVLTGALALVVGSLALGGRAPRWLIVAWTGLSFVTLFAVAGIALASTPLFHAFGTAPEQVNTFVADPPYVWLPTVLVAFALATQLVLVRKLRAG